AAAVAAVALARARVAGAREDPDLADVGGDLRGRGRVDGDRRRLADLDAADVGLAERVLHLQLRQLGEDDEGAGAVRRRRAVLGAADVVADLVGDRGDGAGGGRAERGGVERVL